MKRLKIFFFTIILVALAVSFSDCRTTKGINKSPALMEVDTLSVPKGLSSDTMVATHINTAPFECLPQDKVFLDSLKMNLYNFNNGGYYQTSTYIDTVPAIVRKLFPNVIFYNGALWISTDTKPHLLAYLNSVEYGSAAKSFNYLFKETHITHDYNLEEKLTAFLYTVLGFKSEILIKSINPCDISIPYDIYKYNYETEASINGEIRRCIFCIKANQILSFIVFDANGKIINRSEIYETA